jgi:hypothetical protein
MLRFVLLSFFLILSSCFEGGSGESAFAPSIEMAASVFGSGTLSIKGTVELPPTSSSQRFVQLYIYRSAGTGGGSQIQGSVQTTAAHEVNYTITGLPSGDYQIFLAVDETGNGIFSESGDYEGWYDGTLVSPKQNQASAATIVLSSVSRTGIDFAVGALP